MNMEENLKAYSKQVTEALQALDWSKVELLAQVLEKAKAARRHVFVCGNGGSAATAAHFVTDLNAVAKGFRAVDLTSCSPWMTCIANDNSYAYVFVDQIHP